MTIKKETGWNLDNSYVNLPKSFFTKLNPTKVSKPRLVALNNTLATSIGLNVKELESGEGIEVLAGNRILENTTPIAKAYAGHQFGFFNMLGDGRALLLGEQITPLNSRVDIELKGAGPTPYSRGYDGRATLGSMLREYIISEAMHGLGVPTTRSLAVVTTGDSVFREEEEEEIGAILTRVAASHIRVGTFQFALEWGKKDDLRNLADYTIERHYPKAKKADNPYLAFLKEVIKKQAELVAKWQLVGFIHGVMNTDNVTISGETIDYGPCAFMDTYDPETVFSSIDVYGRYAYKNQPDMTKWNLERFSETLIKLLHKDREEAIKLAKDAISEFEDLYNRNWLEGMRAKLGIFNEEENDKQLMEELLNIMYNDKADYTNTFYELTIKDFENITLSRSEEFTKWYKTWRESVDRQKETKDSSKQLMKSSNAAMIPRNYRVEEAIEAAVKNGDYSVMNKLVNILSKPYLYSEEQIEYSKMPQNNTPYRTFCGT